MKQMLIINIAVVALNIFISVYFLGNNQAQADYHDSTGGIANAIDSVAGSIDKVAEALNNICSKIEYKGEFYSRCN